MDLNKVKEVLIDQQFVEELLQLENVNDVQKALHNKGIELTLDDICKVKELMLKIQNDELSDDEKKMYQLYQNQDSNELNDAELEAVSGGILDPFSLFIIGMAIASTVAASASLVDGLTERRW